MKTYKTIRRKVKVLNGWTCDRCGTDLTGNEMQLQEAWSISTVGGYESVFGDGTLIDLDLCQKCIKDVLGEWIRRS